MEVQRALLDEKDSSLDELDVERIDKAYPKKYDCDRVIIWGGQYRSEEKDRIKKNIGKKEVLIYDIFNNSSDFKGLKDTDLVVIVTSSISHSLYNNLRRHCKKRKIPCLHSRHSGIHPLTEFVLERAA